MDDAALDDATFNDVRPLLGLDGRRRCAECRVVTGAKLEGEELEDNSEYGQ